MKKVIFVVGLLLIAALSFAQQQKKEAIEGLSQDLPSLKLAAALAKYGYNNEDPTALIQAAEIFNSIKTHELEAKSAPDSPKDVKADTNVSFDPKQLIEDAKTYARKNKTVLAYATMVEKQIGSSHRGATGGPASGTGLVVSLSDDTWIIQFDGGRPAEVSVSGLGLSDLDLYVYDENGNLIVFDEDPTDDCYCAWRPKWTGVFTIIVRNCGLLPNPYAIWTN